MDGIHLLGEWFDCPAELPEMGDSEALRSLCLGATRNVGLTVVGDKFHQFAPQGVTGMVLLAESHLAIHTWPEKGFVSVDVYVCNFNADNTARAEQLFEALRLAFRPSRATEHAIRRGGMAPVRKAA